MMKKTILISVLALCYVIANGQPSKGRDAMYEEFRTKRMAYLISAVGMTTEEASELFPLYDEMMKKKMSLFSEVHKAMRKLCKSGGEIKDEEYLRMVDDMINAPIREAQLEKEYYERFKKILSPQKLFKLKMEEGRYAKEILKKQGPPPHRKKESKKDD